MADTTGGPNEVPTDAEAETMRLESGATRPCSTDAQPTARGAEMGAWLPKVPLRLGPYELGRMIGHGGMGVVYEATHEKLGSKCAVKVLIAGTHASSEEIARFQREAAAVARMGKHPNIVTVHDLGEQGNLAYYAMDLVEGTSLRKRLETGVFEPKEAATLVEKVARALHFAHERGVIHRDMKPDNVMVRADGEPQVMDFGLARDVASTERLSITGQIMGTLAYMAPEQARGDVDRQDARTDVYALGGILYEMLTGRTPHPGRTVAELIPLILAGEVLPLRRLRAELPRDLETICLKCLALDPARRYASAQELADDLGRFRRNDPIVARRVSVLERAFRGAVRHRAVVIPSSIAVLLGLGFLVYVKVSSSIKAAAADALAQARKERSAMELTLDKAEKVSAVWGRWLLLAPTIAELERDVYDMRVTWEERKAHIGTRWKLVEQFMETTPPDPASQATMKALAGWCATFVGRPEAAREWLQEAGELDPEVPYGPLIDAFLRFEQYTTNVEMPTIRMDAVTGVHFGPMPPETAEMAEWREGIELLLERVKTARVWGKGAAEQFAGALGAMRKLQEGRLVDAEADLSQSIGAPDLAPFRNGLLLARAKVRHLLGHFDDAIADLEEVRKVRDGSSEVYAYLGLARMARAISGVVKGEDPMPGLTRSLFDFGEALARRESATIYEDRAHAYRVLAEAKAARGLDPREDYERALADFGAALRLAPEDVGTLANRGNLWGDLAAVKANLGEDPTETWSRAIADYDSALRIRPDTLAALVGRCGAYAEVGTLKTLTGQGGRAEFERAVADGDRAVALAPENAVALHNRGTALFRLGEALLGSGEDPSGTLQRAMADFDASLQHDQENIDAVMSRGTVHVLMAMAEAASSKDARDEFRKGISDYDTVIAARPGDPYTIHNRGNARRYLADAETAQGVDARETYRKAIADYDTAATALPDQPDVKGARGEVWLALGEAEVAQGANPRGCYEKAREDMEAMLRAYPQNGELLGRYGQVLEGLGELEKAVEVYRRAVALRGDADPALKERLDAAQAKLKDGPR